MPKIIINNKECYANIGSRISDLEEFKAISSLPCGGIGKCGKCKVKAEGKLSELDSTERSVLSAIEISENSRLACRTFILGDCKIVCQNEGEQIINLDSGEFAGYHNASFERYGIAIDIGSTTLAATLQNSRGTLLAKVGANNLQSSYGADVMTRLSSAQNGAHAEICSITLCELNRLIKELCQKADIDPKEIDRAVITGNTVMLTFLCRLPTESFTHAPFKAPDLFGKTLSAKELCLDVLAGSCPVYLPPCAGAFVGADLICALLASGIAEKEGISMLIDIGTNGEMALCHNKNLTFCSAAAGPAFEGAELSCGMGCSEGAVDSVRIVNGNLHCHTVGECSAKGICGSGIIDALASMRELEIIEESGYLDNSPYKILENVYITQQDIRKIQLAKSAICAALKTLTVLSGLNITQIEKLFIAGGFGNSLNIPNACRISLIPHELSGKCETMGNGALKGAQMLLFDKTLEKQCEKYARGKVIDLSTNPIFADYYIMNMTLG